jgi:hypothetical protein
MGEHMWRGGVHEAVLGALDLHAYGVGLELEADVVDKVLEKTS